MVARTLESSSQEERTDWGVMQEKIRADLKRFLSKQTQRRPLIMPVILEVVAHALMRAAFTLL